MSNWFIKNKIFFKLMIFIIFFKIVIYTTAYFTAQIIPLDVEKYSTDFHHYYLNQRLVDNQVNFFQLWAYSDAQWYLDIAENGYNLTAFKNLPYHSTQSEPNRKFAFFPLWPAIIWFFSLFFKEINLSAFIAVNLISFFAFYYFYKLVILHFNDEKLAVSSLLLLMFFPFSVFYQLYFTESLFLLLTVLVFYFLKQKKWILSYLAAFFLVLTKVVGIFIIIPLFIYLIREAIFKKRREILNYKKFLIKMITLPLISLSLFLFSWFNYLMAKDWWFFVSIQGEWQNNPRNFWENLVNNFSKIRYDSFINLNFHAFHSSKVDVVIMILFGIMIFLSIKKMPKEFFCYSLAVWLAPLISKDLMSFGRFMSVVFPVFIYLGSLLKNKYIFYLILILFELGYAINLIRIISWQWAG